jgi:3-oxoadipate enol-lactonase
MPQIELGDARIFYQLEGNKQAPVVMFSNSLGTDLTMWEPQLAACTQHFRVLRYDTRGHGQSSVTPGPYNIAQLGRDVLALLDGLKLELVSFCGLSLGGIIGQWLGVHAAPRLHKLVLANTAAQIGTVEGWNDRIAAVQNYGMGAIIPTVLDRWYTPGFRVGHENAIERTRIMLESADAQGYMACCAAVRDVNQRESIRSIRIPSLIVAGRFDPVTPPHDGRFLAESIPGAQYVELFAAHLSNVEAADSFTAHLIRFLAA